MKHNFKAALYAFKSGVEGEPNEYEQAVIFGLALADKVTGEIDTTKAIKGLNAFENSFGTPVTRQIASFKAMIAQAIAQSEKETG